MAAPERLCTVTKTFKKIFLTTVGETEVQSSVGDPWHFGADPDLWLMDLDPAPTPDPTNIFVRKANDPDLDSDQDPKREAQKHADPDPSPDPNPQNWFRVWSNVS
jgi:hypothetical protein